MKLEEKVYFVCMGFDAQDRSSSPVRDLKI